MDPEARRRFILETIESALRILNEDMDIQNATIEDAALNASEPKQ